MKVSKTNIMLIKSEAHRVLELLDELKFNEDGETLSWTSENYSKIAELKSKMKELRRDTIRLGKELRGY